MGRHGEVIVAHLNVEPAELLAHADRYSGLAAAMHTISPNVAERIMEIADSHGPIALPAVVGMVKRLAPHEASVLAQATKFDLNGQRLTEHAAAYTAEDTAAAARNAQAAPHGHGDPTPRPPTPTDPGPKPPGVICIVPKDKSEPNFPCPPGAEWDHVTNGDWIPIPKPPGRN